MSLEPSTPRSRRAILGVALGSVLGAAAGVLGRTDPTLAANGDNLVLGQANDAAATTVINNPTSSFSSLWGHATATSGTGVGVRGDTETPDGAGVWGNSSAGMGVHGTSGAATGVRGDSTGGIGVHGTSTADVGVHGTSTSSVGVFGEGGTVGVEATGSVIGVYGGSAGTGVYGSSASGTGVTAYTVTGVALSVHGKLALSRSGRASVSSGHSTRVVSMAGVTKASYVIATPQTNRSGVYVQAVVPATGKFTIYLNKAVSGTTWIGYIVVN